MARAAIALLIATLLFSQFASAQSNCQGIDIFWVFGSSTSLGSYVYPAANVLFNNYGRNITMMCTDGAATSTMPTNWISSYTTFTASCNQQSAGIKASALQRAVSRFNKDNVPSNKRRVLVIVYDTGFDSIGNLVSYARMIKETTSIEVYVIDHSSAARGVDLATGGVSNNLYGNYYWNVNSFPGSLSQSLAQKITKTQEISSGTCWGIGGLIGTFDGNSYNFPGYGEFWLVRSPSSVGVNVQVRTESCTSNAQPTSTTCIRSVAVNIATNFHVLFSFEPAEGTIFVQQNNGGSISYMPLPRLDDSTSVGSWTMYYDIIYSPLSAEPMHQIRLSGAADIYMYFGKNLPGQVEVKMNYGFGYTSGLCGTWDGCSANDYWTNAQTVVAPGSSAEAVYFNFANTWRVSRFAESFWTTNPRTNADYDKPLEPYSPNFQPVLSKDVSGAAPVCSQFGPASRFFEAACLYGETNGFANVKSVVAYSLLSECASFCYSDYIPPANAISVDYCKSLCFRPTALYDGSTVFPYYNSTTTPPPYEVYTNSYTLSNQIWVSIGGTYTFEFADDWACTVPTATLNVVCSYTPTINAGADRVVTKERYGYPTILLQGTASDTNTKDLQYWWSVVDFPRAVDVPAEPSSFKRQQGYVVGNEPSVGAQFGLVALFRPAYPGDYVFELKAFDGCGFSNDTVKITVVCGDCTMKTQSYVYDSTLPYPETSSTYAWAGFYDDWYSNYGSLQWFLNSNSHGWTQRQDTSGSSRTYHLVYVPPETITGSNQTQSSDTQSYGPSISSSVVSGSFHGVSITRNEALRTTTEWTNVTTTTFVHDIYYSSVPVDEPRCDVAFSDYQSGWTGISTTSMFNSGDAFAFTKPENRYCDGDYQVRTDFVYDCLESSSVTSFRAQCGAKPEVHLVSCNKVFQFDYDSLTFPTIYLDARDTIDQDTSQLYYAYEVVSKPFYSSFGNRVTPSYSSLCTGTSDAEGALLDCTAGDIYPDEGGSYTIRLRVTDTCSEDSESTSFTINCDALTINSIDGGNSFNDGGNTADYNRIILNSTYTSTNNHPVWFNWRFISGPDTPSPDQSSSQGYDFRVYRGGVYTVEFLVSDYCQRIARNHTFTYTCSQNIVPSVSIMGGTWDETNQVFNRLTLNASASTYINVPVRGYAEFYLISAPAGSNAPSYGYNEIDFIPDQPGVYNYSLVIDDGCQTSVTYWTATAGPCPTLPNPSVGISPSASQALNLPINTTVVFEILTDPVNANQTKTVAIYEPDGTIYTTSTADNVFVYASIVGTWTVEVYVDSYCTPAPVLRSTVTFTVTCGIAITVSGNPAATSSFVNGKFSRVSLTPTVAVTNPSVNLADYYDASSWMWEFVSAPSDSAFNVVLNSVVTDVGNMSNPIVVGNYTDLGNGVWRTRVEYTQVTTVTRTVQQVKLTNNDEQNRFVGCFAPDRPGTYSLVFSMTDFCGNKLTTTGTVTATCNGAPTAAVANSTINFSWLQSGPQYIVLDSKPSSDPEGDSLTYQWHIVAKPEDSDVNDGWLYPPTAPLSIFYPDRPGKYVITLTVSDGCSVSSTNLTINVLCSPGTIAPSSITYVHDGYTPVSVAHFIFSRNPYCPYSFYAANLKEFVPAPYNQFAPPPPTEEVSGASNVVATLLAIVLAVLVVMF